MTRTWADTLGWMKAGQRLFDKGVQTLDEDAFSADIALPGWSRRHLVAHVAGNAEALTNLVAWAATGIERPMYASKDARAAGIAEGARMSGASLREWQARAAAELEDRLGRLDDLQWRHEVRTVQGRVLPATEIPWLRAREVMVHAVDLDCGVSFSDLPDDFLHALVADIVRMRGGVPVPSGPVPEIAAWLAGRRHALEDAPSLGPWL